MTTIAMRDKTPLVRPLRVLVPLIKDDLKRGQEAAERAATPYYIAAGEKLLEAKAQIPLGEFMAWVSRHFTITHRQANNYMTAAQIARDQNGSALPFSSLRETLRESGYSGGGSTTPSWKPEVAKIVSRVDTETLNLAREELKRADERDAQRVLALQLIDIGYKVLARKLHPDKGGSREAMSRLNAVRERLKLHA